MATEIEAKFININKDDLRSKLKAAGAKLIQPETKMPRAVFDMGPNKFARVRDEGGCITMSYKESHSHTLSGMEEICLEVDNYEEAIAFLKALGLKIKAEQETLREEWELDGVKLDIDTWPWIPSYVEIEGPSEETVARVAKKLGFDMEEAIYGSAAQVFQQYFDVDEHDINYYPEIKFTSVPDWLEAKRKK